MVSLARKSGESVVIGKDVEVRVLGVEDGRVRLGITAPYMPVLRGEIADRIRTATGNSSKVEQLFTPQ